MYIPAAFRESDTAKLHEFMQQYSFGILTTQSSSGLFASHLPFLVDPSRGPLGTLLGHFAKGNDQIEDFDREALAVFSGPHAYVSPTWYETPNTVPTWNYVAVHAYGVLRHVTDCTELAEILAATVDKYERSQPTPWEFDPSTEFHDKLMEGIVGFRIEITKLEGKWKLNQNHPPERRERVIQMLRSLGGEDRLAIANLMADKGSEQSAET